MTRIHNDEVKHVKDLKSHYSHILHGCMNTRKDIVRFKNFHILLYSGCSLMIVLGRLVQKLSTKKDAKYAPMQ